MAKKVVKPDYNIDGMEITSIFKNHRAYERLPYISIAQGPTRKCLYELFYMHYVGRLHVVMQLNHPKLYRFLMRARNSLVFRFNHYRKVILRKLGK